MQGIIYNISVIFAIFRSRYAARTDCAIGRRHNWHWHCVLLRNTTTDASSFFNATHTYTLQICDIRKASPLAMSQILMQNTCVANISKFFTVNTCFVFTHTLSRVFQYGTLLCVRLSVCVKKGVLLGEMGTTLMA